MGVVDEGAKKVTISSKTKDSAGFGTANEFNQRIFLPTLHEENVNASYSDERINAVFANGETGPYFNVRVTEDSKSIWEFGFDYSRKLSGFPKVMSRVLVQLDTTKSTVNEKQLFNLMTYSCTVGQEAAFKYLHEGQN